MLSDVFPDAPQHSWGQPALCAIGHRRRAVLGDGNAFFVAKDNFEPSPACDAAKPFEISNFAGEELPERLLATVILRFAKAYISPVHGFLLSIQFD